jgi:hypothetical protein
MMMKPICVPCERFYRPAKNGISFLEGMPNGTDTPPRSGKGHADEWDDYKLWMGDKWRCPGCDHEIVVGFGREPLAVQHEPTFRKDVDSYKPAFRVNDC